MVEGLRAEGLRVKVYGVKVDWLRALSQMPQPETPKAYAVSLPAKGLVGIVDHVCRGPHFAEGGVGTRETLEL